MLTENEKEAIRSETRGILARFGKELERVTVASSSSLPAGILRTPREGCSDADFRRRMFANAPRKTKECIVAEKASW